MAEFAAQDTFSRKRLRADSLWLTLPGLAYMALLLILPAGALIWQSFVDPKSGAFDLSVYRQMFSAGVYVKVLANTFSISAQVTFVCLLVGYPIAVWLAGMDERRRRLAMWLVLLPFWVSPLLKNFAWIVLLARKGIVAQMLTGMGFDTQLDLLYGRGAVIFGMAHAMLPIAILTMLPTMLSIDGRLIPAAMTMGASRSQSFWRIFVPLSMPGVAAAGLLIFVMGLGFFITPALLGSPRETVIGQMMITQVQQLFNLRLGGALAALLLGVTLITIAVYDRFFGMSAASGHGVATRRGGVIGAIGGAVIEIGAVVSDFVANLFPARLGRGVFTTFVWIVIAILIVPVLAFPPMAFSGSSFLEFPPKSFSLRWFQTYLSSDQWMGATTRSAVIAIITGVVATIISGMAAYGLARTQRKAGGLIFLSFMLPMIVPNIVIGVSLFYVLAKVGLIASNTGIILGHTLSAMPIVFVILLTTFRSFDWRLLQAAGTLGANGWQQIRLILLPLIKGGAIAAFLFGLLHSFEELTIALFVGAGVKQTLPKQMWDDIILSISPTLAAASVFIVAVVTVLFVIAEKARPR
ncbi:ABC transporter permease subunit [Agrobacterium rubi]|nr:ABC transporter permease subunit [Agrobacterium rubi]MBP1881192.1 putative spermidine/putrescine transport system permease protein [Agrobacterium rubi]MCL6654548.1 ABC transporter permease [Agrobacterium rubi]NTF09277.1 ABC transporter permease subunit [Agrobacterium rubi]NTF22186.1 ABC transporter permease subunit [Agrobacterium rubi]NTF29043.1 ABC transporter permease subunit [Agrobacterium rubi]